MAPDPTPDPAVGLGDGLGADHETDLSDEPTTVIDAAGDLVPGSRSDFDPQEASQAMEAFLLGAEPSLTRVEVAARAGVPLALAEQMWNWLGFPHTTNEDVAFTDSDVEALRLASDLMRMGILEDDSLAALVRTWGRSYARLAEWQTTLLAEFAIDGPDTDLRITELAAGVLPRVEALQSYVWRRHLSSAATRLLTTTGGVDTSEMPLAVCFVDIVGYTSQSKNLTEHELVEMIERFEQTATDAVVQGGGRVIKTIGDEILFAADDARAATDIALELTARGGDDEDEFPAVRAGVAYGPVVARLGDVFGATVNIAARLTSVARPGSVVVDGGAHAALQPPDQASDTTADVAPGAGPDTEHEGDTAASETPADPAEDTTYDDPSDEPAQDATPAYRFKRLRRVSVKGYSRLEAWAVRPPKAD